MLATSWDAIYIKKRGFQTHVNDAAGIIWQTLGTGGDVPSRLLYAVAKGREEAVSLAVQLAEKSEEARRERAECDHLKVGRCMLTR